MTNLSWSCCFRQLDYERFQAHKTKGFLQCTHLGRVKQYKYRYWGYSNNNNNKSKFIFCNSIEVDAKCSNVWFHKLINEIQLTMLYTHSRNLMKINK